MVQQRSVKLSRIVDEFSLEILHKGSDYDSALLTIVDVNRPGLQYAGFFEYFDPVAFRWKVRRNILIYRLCCRRRRRKSYSNLFSYEIPALVLSRDMEPSAECLETAREYERTLLRTPETTVVFTSQMIDALNRYLAPALPRHGVLMEIYGEGVLIMGDSGVGKSETAIRACQARSPADCRRCGGNQPCFRCADRYGAGADPAIISNCAALAW